MRKMRRFRSSYACSKIHPGFWSLSIHYVVSNDFVIGQKRPRLDCADVQADLGLCCPHMPVFALERHIYKQNMSIILLACTVLSHQ